MFEPSIKVLRGGVNSESDGDVVNLCTVMRTLEYTRGKSKREYLSIDVRARGAASGAC